jgi:class 3 adenylate cyclase/tRNA A-37 threonylcarbamoyl transferase component Bud32/ActR/RegA family two-component response regulator
MEGRLVGGKYTLERELARGGMGAIWVAHDTHLQRRVALKLMSPDHLASPAARSRFEREAKSIAKLQSPHVVQIYEYGVDEGAPYIVMELLEGEDLQARLSRMPRLGLPVVASILNQASKALGAAHGAGIVHRDIKPANIFLARHDTDEVVKVLDFGVAALVSGLGSGDVHVTRAGGVVGTPHFMSPEQVRGAKGIDFRSDLWSLGVVAYRAVTGRLPFEADAFGELLIQICTDPVPPPSKLAADLGPEVDRFFERALARDPSRRFGSAREMATAFAEIAATGRSDKATKILVVDDEADVALLMRQRFRQQIRKGLYEFVFATDGEAALEQMRLFPDIEIALTDINMPGMDGLTFLRRAGELNPLVKVVVVSAYSDMSNIREAMNRGAFDFLVKPIDFKDLEVTIDKTIKHARDVRRTAISTEENGILRMFVNTAIVERLVPILRAADASPSEAIEATVAFVDVHDFSAMARSASPEQALRALNACFEIIVPEITSRGGQVDKFVGDVVMAVFRGEGHAVRAVEACYAARSALSALAERSGEGSVYGLGLAVGVDSGQMIAGSIGSKVVSRLDYTVLGEVVSTAARLQALALKGEILVSDAVRRAAEATFTFDARELQVQTQRAEPTAVFSVGGRAEAESPLSAAETVLMDRDEVEPAAHAV